MSASIKSLCSGRRRRYKSCIGGWTSDVCSSNADQIITIKDRHDFVKKLTAGKYSDASAFVSQPSFVPARGIVRSVTETDRKSTRLNSSHRCISYAVFCLKKKKKQKYNINKT